MYEIKNIAKVTYNNKKVKLFEAWQIVDNARIFAGRFTAPVKTANKNLGNYITE